MAKPTADDGGVIIERVVVGRYARVTAVDPTTGVEATVVADSKAPLGAVQQLAIRKLKKVMSGE